MLFHHILSSTVLQEGNIKATVDCTVLRGEQVYQQV